MRILPTTGQQWTSLLLFPFKAYTALAYFAALIGINSLPPRADYTEAVEAITLGYVVSFAAFCWAAMIQKSVGPRRSFVTSCGFAVADLVFVVLMLPYLARA
jgi:hypothetical protein